MRYVAASSVTDRYTHNDYHNLPAHTLRVNKSWSIANFQAMHQVRTFDAPFAEMESEMDSQPQK